MPDAQSRHLSDLLLDERAAGAAVSAEATAHLDACAECRARADTLGSGAAKTSQSVGYARTRARLLSAAAEHQPHRSRWALLLAPVVAASLALVVVVVSGTGDEVRLKGGPRIELVDMSGNAVQRARAGERVAVRLGTGGRSHARVIAVNEDGTVEALWPPAADPGALPPAAAATLEPAFEVTEGSVALLAFFSDRPIDARRAEEAVRAAVHDSRGPAVDVAPPEGIAEDTAQVVLQVAR